jgi:hypothetical protein
MADRGEDAIGMTDTRTAAQTTIALELSLKIGGGGGAGMPSFQWRSA